MFQEQQSSQLYLAPNSNPNPNPTANPLASPSVINVKTTFCPLGSYPNAIASSSSPNNEGFQPSPAFQRAVLVNFTPPTAKLLNEARLPNPIYAMIPQLQPLNKVKWRKAHKQPKMVQTVWCEICKISCNSPDIFSKHLQGKGHLKKLSKMDASTPIIAPTNVGKEPQPLQSLQCEICEINCNSLEMLGNHLLGKKHQKNLEKSRKPIGPPASVTDPATAPAADPATARTNNPATAQPIGPVQKPNKNGKRSMASEEDLEVKKRKVLEGGAAADKIRVCAMCKVVCNSADVFITHLAGQKHLAMAKKMEDAGCTG